MPPPPKVLHSWNPNQCATSQPIEVQLGIPTITLMIFSGIAIPELYVDDDETTVNYEVLLKLGVNVSGIHEYVAQVGLASISNDESQFAFSTDVGRLERDPETSELQLYVNTSLLGEESYLHRFSYQIVAQVTKIDSRISGVIRVPRTVLDLANKTQAELDATFRVRAQHVEMIPSPGQPHFSDEHLTPVANGRIEGISYPPGSDDCFVNYVIDGCPFNIPLRVTVDITSLLANLKALRLPGPDPVELSIFVPTVAGIDFAVVVASVK